MLAFSDKEKRPFRSNSGRDAYTPDLSESGLLPELKPAGSVPWVMTGVQMPNKKASRPAGGFDEGFIF